MTDQDDLPRYEMFSERYANGDMPWDSGITPPEIMAIIDELPPGIVLDLGCGTGTNVITLAQHGWRAYGVDYVPQAIEIARKKVAEAGLAERISLYVSDARKIGALGLPPADLVVDIGCGHVFRAAGFPAYMDVVAQALKPGGTWMLYIHHWDEERERGLEPDVVLRHAAPDFDVVRHDVGTDTPSGEGASWFRLRRVTPPTR